MKNTELIKIIAENPLTETQVFNLIVNDLFEAVPQKDAETGTSQRLIQYFHYKITQTLYPVIAQLKGASHSGEPKGPEITD